MKIQIEILRNVSPGTEKEERWQIEGGRRSEVAVNDGERGQPHQGKTSAELN